MKKKTKMKMIKTSMSYLCADCFAFTYAILGTEDLTLNKCQRCGKEGVVIEFNTAPQWKKHQEEINKEKGVPFKSNTFLVFKHRNPYSTPKARMEAYEVAILKRNYLAYTMMGV